MIKNRLDDGTVKLRIQGDILVLLSAFFSGIPNLCIVGWWLLALRAQFCYENPSKNLFSVCDTL